MLKVKEGRFSVKYIVIILAVVANGLVITVNSQIKNFIVQQNNCILERDEKVYVQLDKNIYISGEELKFKAYVVNSSTLKKSLQSKVLYFELSGNKGTRVFSWRTNLNRGLCLGSVILPDTISGGIYTLRAYTNWMRNISSDYFYTTRIIITRISDGDLKQLWLPDTLTDRIESWQSAIYDKKTGIKLDIDTSQTDRLIVSIRSAPEHYLYDKSLRLITQLRGRIINNVPVILNDSVVKVEISKSDISPGIFNIVLTDPYYNNVCEKPVFISPGNYPSLTINTSKTIYGKKEKVTLELDLNTPDLNDTAWVSISVTERTPFQSVLENPGIVFYLLFFSEIAGNPYFNDSSLLKPEHYPGITTQTNKSYKYATGLIAGENNDTCKYIMENKGFVLNGKIIDRSTGKPVKNELVLLSYIDSISSLKYCFTDAGGNFYFLLDHSYDNRELILQLINHNNSNDQIIWQPDSKYSPGLSDKYRPVPVPAGGEEYLEFARQIELVNNTYRLNRKTNDLPVTEPVKAYRRNFYGRFVSEVYPSDFIELIDFRDISENILPGVKFRKRGDICFIQIYDHSNKIIMPPEATVLLNGVPFNDLNYISTLGSNDIKQIDIHSTQLMYGDLSFYGLLSIITYDMEIPDTYLQNNAYVFNNKVQSSFMDVNINTDKQLNNNVNNQPDFRHTLLWEPSLTLTGKDKANIEFYTSELNAVYNITVQGLTSGGIPLEAKSEIEVKQ